MTSESWQLRCAELKQRGAYLYQSKLWSDCTFRLASQPGDDFDVTIKAHKLMMAMASPVFAKMLYKGIVKLPVPIYDVRPEVFNTLLEYIYSDNLNIASSKDACDLYHAAKKWRIPHVAKCCTTYLNEHMSPENVCHIYKLACENEDTLLQQTCEKVFSMRTKEILKEKSFYEADLNLVKRLFSLEHLNIDSELDLFEAAVKYAANQERKTKTRNVLRRTNEASMENFIDSGIPLSPAKKIRRISFSQGNDDITMLNVEGSSSNASEAAINVEYGTVSTPTKDAPISNVQNKLKFRELISNIRFLSLTPQQLGECALLSALLTDAEVLAILMNVASRETIYEMPEGLSTCMVPRTLNTKEDRTRLAASFRSIIHNFRNVQKHESTYFYMRNLAWSLMILTHSECQDELVLGVTCFFEAGPPEWLKNTKVKVKFCTHRPVPKHLHKISLKPSIPTLDYGAWVIKVNREELLNPEYGFVDDLNTVSYKLYINTLPRPDESEPDELPNSIINSISEEHLSNFVLRRPKTPVHCESRKAEPSTTEPDTTSSSTIEKATTQSISSPDAGIQIQPSPLSVTTTKKTQPSITTTCQLQPSPNKVTVQSRASPNVTTDQSSQPSPKKVTQSKPLPLPNITTGQPQTRSLPTEFSDQPRMSLDMPTIQSEQSQPPTTPVMTTSQSQSKASPTEGAFSPLSAKMTIGQSPSQPAHKNFFQSQSRLSSNEVTAQPRSSPNTTTAQSRSCFNATSNLLPFQPSLKEATVQPRMSPTVTTELITAQSQSRPSSYIISDQTQFPSKVTVQSRPSPNEATAQTRSSLKVISDPSKHLHSPPSPTVRAARPQSQHSLNLDFNLLQSRQSPKLTSALSQSLSSPKVTSSLAKTLSSPKVTSAFAQCLSSPKVTSARTHSLSYSKVNSALTQSLSSPEVASALTQKLSSHKVTSSLAISPTSKSLTSPRLISLQRRGVNDSQSSDMCRLRKVVTARSQSLPPGRYHLSRVITPRSQSLPSGKHRLDRVNAAQSLSSGLCRLVSGQDRHQQTSQSRNHNPIQSQTSNIASNQLLQSPNAATALQASITASLIASGVRPEELGRLSRLGLSPLKIYRLLSWGLLPAAIGWLSLKSLSSKTISALSQTQPSRGMIAFLNLITTPSSSIRLRTFPTTGSNITSKSINIPVTSESPLAESAKVAVKLPNDTVNKSLPAQTGFTPSADLNIHRPSLEKIPSQSLLGVTDPTIFLSKSQLLLSEHTANTPVLSQPCPTSSSGSKLNTLPQSEVNTSKLQFPNLSEPSITKIASPSVIDTSLPFNKFTPSTGNISKYNSAPLHAVTLPWPIKYTNTMTNVTRRITTNEYLSSKTKSVLPSYRFNYEAGAGSKLTLMHIKPNLENFEYTEIKKCVFQPKSLQEIVLSKLKLAIESTIQTKLVHENTPEPIKKTFSESKSISENEVAENTIVSCQGNNTTCNNDKELEPAEINESLENIKNTADNLVENEDSENSSVKFQRYNDKLFVANEKETLTTFPKSLKDISLSKTYSFIKVEKNSAMTYEEPERNKLIIVFDKENKKPLKYQNAIALRTLAISSKSLTDISISEINSLLSVRNVENSKISGKENNAHNEHKLFKAFDEKSKYPNKGENALSYFSKSLKVVSLSKLNNLIHVENVEGNSTTTY